MKKTLVAGLVGLLAAATFAGKDNVVITFATRGPDTYADGSRVLDGETYALVWTKDGATFQGINADGTAVGEDVGDNKVVLKAPVAKDGKCPFIKFEIDETYATNFTGGAWGVYLLDTRTFAATPGANGKPVATDELGSAVNGYGAVATALTATQFVSANAAKTKAVETPADKGEVKIRDIKLVGDKVFIYVSGTVSSAAYAVAEGATPDAMTTQSAEVGNTAGDMIIVREQRPGGAFFKVSK